MSTSTGGGTHERVTKDSPRRDKIINQTSTNKNESRRYGSSVWLMIFYLIIIKPFISGKFLLINRWHIKNNISSKSISLTSSLAMTIYLAARRFYVSRLYSPVVVKRQQRRCASDTAGDTRIETPVATAARQINSPADKPPAYWADSFLPFCLDALSNHLHPKAIGKIDDHVDQIGGALVHRYHRDKRPIDFQKIICMLPNMKAPNSPCQNRR